MAGLVQSSYYRKPTDGKKGNRPSELTFHKKKGSVSQDTVIAFVKSVLKHPFIDCGYRLMTSYLKRDDFIINHNKLYRIMRGASLPKLNDCMDRSGSARKFVKFRNVKTTRPFECLEMDINVVWIPNAGKNAYLLSVIDVYTRRILRDLFSFSIKQQQVIELLSDLFME